MNADRRGARGFTLIELIAAFAILAVAFGVLMEVNTSAMRSARRSADFSRAALHAQSKLDELGVGTELSEGAESGRFDDGMEWRLDVRREEAPAAANGLVEELPVDLYRLELTVSWRQGRDEREARFVTLRAVQSDGSPGRP